MPTILCFGDSNTFGLDPVTRGRHPEAVRWPGALRRLLPAGFEVVEEGLCGRTTVLDDPCDAGLRGMTYLRPCLASHAPVDLVVLMLGTNDLRAPFGCEAPRAARGVWSLAYEARASLMGPGGRGPQVLVVAPPPVAPPGPLAEVWGFTVQAAAESRRLAGCLELVARELACPFLDAGAVASASPADGIHLDAEGHARLARAVAGRVVELVPSPG